MPELPEVEVSRRGLLPILPGQCIVDAVFRAPKLRHEIPSQLSSRLTGLRIDTIQRRGKYLLFDCESRQGGGWLILHQRLSVREGFGCVLIFAAVVLAQLPVEEWRKCRAGNRK